MKNTLLITIIFILLLSLTACKTKKVDLTIDRIKEEFKKNGFVITKELEAPEIDLTGASNIYQIYFGDTFVVFYEYESSKTLQSALKIFSHFKNNAINSNWMMANGTIDMRDLFKGMK